MERQYLTVTALNRYLKFKFDNDRNLQDILLKAEISNFRRHSRGHLYFTLKDDASQIAAVMFASLAASLSFAPKDGMQVIIEGYVSVYEQQGSYQVYVKKMTQAGVGDLYQAYNELKQRLEAEGLFRDERKQRLPRFPGTIGVITSPTGAAVRDIIHIINRRYPLARILIYPALVQGEEAKTSLKSQIEKANADRLADVLIVGRGGGSIEDLWAFNEEVVVRAVRASKIPIISAVGHETDFTITDFAADHRAPTPSGAAEIAVPDQRDLLETIHSQEQKLKLLVSRLLKAKAERLTYVTQAAVIRHPEKYLDNLEMRFCVIEERLKLQQPLQLLKRNRELVTNQEKTMAYHIGAMLEKRRLWLNALAEKLDLVNPFAIIGKGYAIVSKQTKYVKSVADAAIGDAVDIRLQDGTLACLVQAIRKEEN